ncbi:MAG: hypothetical protein ACI8WB_005530, partial [Phenylobacterium sp.]
ADTFAHYGFSGISSQANYIDDDTFDFDSELPSDSMSYILKKWTRFKINLEGDAAEALSKGLGHGAAHTYPDRPYLKWNFKYEDGRESGERSNPDTFLEACEKLHNFFVEYGKADPSAQDRPPTPFSDIKTEVTRILGLTLQGDGRIQAWKDAIASGSLFVGEQVPQYDANLWLNELKSIEDMTDSSEALQLDAFKFLQATAIHRTFVLRELLPAHGLLVR